MLFLACFPANETLKGVIAEENPIVKIDSIENNNEILSTNLDSLWHFLVFEKGGCLTGGQYFTDNKIGNRHCIINDLNVWGDFFMSDTTELTKFLISKFSSTDTTKIHTCPFYEATEGELAIYLLQKIYKINWYDFEYFREYRKRETTSSLDSRQTWIQQILLTEADRKKMILYWEEL